ncbi:MULTISPECIES: PaaX family transcriptional regulator [Actinomadura]|uniref:Transcriptional regulator, PaaX family n=1 Tax=Actinomadura madurae TaxID=1993 RepID=A0A1I5IAJ0_9ACTN|nr:PaaX family transcriptional regulator C-terminal domain-containing protein [Actinomadura madurae]SFO57614.1 transcriptional regulator, PaaX family [Actinomadura madurae]
MARTGEDAARPEPRFRRRRELGAASARSLLLTVLGEFVLPGGRPVWTATFLRALGLLGVEEKAVRQALARSAGEGWLAGERHGRRTAWRLTPAGERLLTDGTERIYGFGGPVGDWDGRWLVVLATVPETSRRLRHLLRTRLAWNGLGNLSPGVWVSPHPEREQEVREVLAEIGVAGSSTLFVGRLGDLDEARRVARQAWDLDEIELAYEDFLDAAGALCPADDAGTFAAHTRLVQEWRRFPFLDPGLPAELLPDDWSGSQAFALFHERHDAWRPVADRQWKAMET